MDEAGEYDGRLCHTHNLPRVDGCLFFLVRWVLWTCFPSPRLARFRNLRQGFEDRWQVRCHPRTFAYSYHWADPRSSNYATMRFESEAQHGANNGLNVARDLMEKVKQQFPWISYGDLWTLGGVAAIQVRT